MMKFFHRVIVILPLLILLALLLRLPEIRSSFYGDESFTLVRDTHQLITTTDDRFRPLFFSIVYLWKQLGFHGELGLRLVPLFFGLLQIPLAFFIGKRLGGDRLARVFALLIACSPLLIEFSQELRMYSMIAAVGLAQLLTALRVIEKSSWSRWLWFALIGLIGVYTHLHYWLFLLCFIFLFYRERKTIPLWHGLAAIGSVAVLYLPNLANLTRFAEARSGSYWVDLPSALPKLIAAFAVGFNYFELPDQSLGRAVGMSDLARNLPLTLLLAIPAVIVLAILVRLHVKNPRDRALLTAHELCTIPVILAAIATLVTKQYWLQPKYLIFSAPFALLFAACGYLDIERGLLRRAVAVCGAAVAIVAMIHFWNPQYYGRRENWIALTDLLKREVTAESTLLVFPEPYRLLGYYWPNVSDHWQHVEAPPAKEFIPDYAVYLRRQLGGKRDVFYIRWDTYQNELDPHDVLPQALDLLGPRAASIQFNPRFFLYRWSLPTTP